MERRELETTHSHLKLGSLSEFLLYPFPASSCCCKTLLLWKEESQLKYWTIFFTMEVQDLPAYWRLRFADILFPCLLLLLNLVLKTRDPKITHTSDDAFLLVALPLFWNLVEPNIFWIRLMINDKNNPFNERVVHTCGQNGGVGKP